MTRWTIRPALACLTFLLLAHPAPAQDAVKALEAALKGKQMELRNYSADKTARYEWSDGKFVEAPIQTRTLAVFVTQSVEIKNGNILIKGERSTLLRDPKDNSLGLSGREQMILEVDTNGVDPTVVLPQIRGKLFFADAREAVNSLPEQIAPFLHLSDPNSQAQVLPRITVFEDGRWARLKQDSTVTPAATVFAPRPGYPDAAKQAKAAGLVICVVYISESGRVTDIWLVRPLGFGLDEATTEALRQYVFKPTQHNGRAVGTEAEIETKFSIY